MTTDTDALDNKGFSEETCVRCGWRMGQPALNCNNDDTPHRFPSQQTPSSPDTEALLATVREALIFDKGTIVERRHTRGLAALDSLAAELERVKAERDEDEAELYRLRMRLTEERRALNDLNEGHKVQEDRAELAEARLDKARKALQRLGGMTHGEDTMRIIREALKETESASRNASGRRP